MVQAVNKIVESGENDIVWTASWCRFIILSNRSDLFYVILIFQVRGLFEGIYSLPRY